MQVYVREPRRTTPYEAWRTRDSQRPGVPLLHGVRVARGHDVGDPLLRARAAGLVLPSGGVLAEWAAAAVHGVPRTWLDGRSLRGDPLPIPAVVAPPMRPYVRRGLVVRQGRLSPDDVVEVDGLVVTSGVRTAFDPIRHSANLPQAVATGDAALWYALTTREEVEGYVRRRPRWRGVGRARAAVPLLDARSESPPESITRVMWTQSGLGVPVPQVLIADANGNVLACVDLFDEKAGVVGEYQGAWHRLGTKPWADTQRRRGLETVGLEVADIWSRDIASQRLLVAVLEPSYRLAARRDPADRTYQLLSPNEMRAFRGPKAG
jgi:hypothetical protein